MRNEPCVDAEILNLIFNDADYAKESKHQKDTLEDVLSYKYIMRGMSNPFKQAGEKTGDKGKGTRSMDSAKNDLNDKLVNDIVLYKIQKQLRTA